MLLKPNLSPELRSRGTYNLKPVSGFTMIELVLYLAIASILYVVIIAFVQLSLEIRIRQEAIEIVESEGDATMSAIIQRVKNAQSVTSPTASSTAASLTLAMPSANINPTVFELSNAAIRISEQGTATTALTSSRIIPGNLIFTNIAGVGTPGSVRFQFWLEYNNPGSISSYNYRRHFIGGASLRNN